MSVDFCKGQNITKDESVREWDRDRTVIRHVSAHFTQWYGQDDGMKEVHGIPYVNSVSCTKSAYSLT